MAAYVVVKVEVTRPDQFKIYQQLAAASVAKHGGRFIVRGGKMVELEGTWDAPRMVVLEFDSSDKALAWYNSSEYREAIEARKGAANFSMVVLEGNSVAL